MKLSELTDEVICAQLRENPGTLEEEDWTLLEAMRQAAASYCASYTGLDETQLDEHEDITIAALMLLADMWDSRTATIEKGIVNPVADTILGMHSANLIPGEADCAVE